MGSRRFEKVFWAWRERVLGFEARHPPATHRHFQESRRLGGASLEHSHSQLIALPIVPRELKGELQGAKRHFPHARTVCVLRYRPAGGRMGRG
jgi:UDPglucose--hexose-1-phosphate uridylyltransferase